MIAADVKWPDRSEGKPVPTLEEAKKTWLSSIKQQRKALSRRGKSDALVLCPSLVSLQLTLLEIGLLALPSPGVKLQAAKATLKIFLALGKSIAVRRGCLRRT